MSKDNGIKVIEETINQKNGTFLNVTYHINKDKGIVICRIYPGYDEMSILTATKESYIKSLFNRNAKEFYSGKARCSEEDTFNEEYGKRLAYNKAMRKYQDCKSGFYRFLARTYKEELSIIYGCISKAENSRILSEQRIDKMTDNYSEYIANMKV